MNPRDLLTRLREVFRSDAEASAIVSDAARVSSGLSRRQFLRAALITTAIAATVDVERLLWLPGEQAIILPARAILAGSTFVTPDWICRESLRILRNQLALVGRFSQEYSDRLPGRYRLA